MNTAQRIQTMQADAVTKLAECKRLCFEVEMRGGYKIFHFADNSSLPMLWEPKNQELDRKAGMLLV